MNNKIHEARNDPKVHGASDVKQGETYIGKTGKYIATNGAEVNLNANGSWDWVSMNNTEPEAGYVFDNNAFYASIDAKRLHQFAVVGEILTGFLGGGIGGVEAGIT